MNPHDKARLLHLSSAVLLLALIAVFSHARAGKALSGDEVKALITGKTVSVKRNVDSSAWKSYFTDDGSAFLDNSPEKKSWHVDDKGRHCNTDVKLKCAVVADNGDGTYSRMKPNGEPAVTWTKIVDGKSF